MADVILNEKIELSCAKLQQALQNLEKVIRSKFELINANHTEEIEELNGEIVRVRIENDEISGTMDKLKKEYNQLRNVVNDTNSDISTIIKDIKLLVDEPYANS